MKGIIIIVSCFILGAVSGYFEILPNFILQNDISTKILMFLLFLVGISLGLNTQTLAIFRYLNYKILLVPITCIVGTYVGVIIVSLFLKTLSLKDALAVGSGFGYYSLSTLIIKEARGEYLSVVALMCNIFREIFTLSFAPYLVLYFGKLAPIVSGGATSMDTTMPIIVKYSGRDFMMVSLVNGVILTLLVPVLVSLFTS